jgi:hypothetical protein
MYCYIAGLDLLACLPLQLRFLIRTEYMRSSAFLEAFRTPGFGLVPELGMWWPERL